MLENVWELILFFLFWVFVVGLNVLIFAYVSAKHNTSAYLIGGVASYIVLANVLASKIMQLGMFVVPAGVVVYSLIFLINDILSEKFGKRYAQRGVYAGVIMNIMFFILIYLGILAPEWNTEQGKIMAENFANTLGMTARIIIASVIAFAISQSFNVLIYHFLKEKTKSRHLWLRNNISTSLSQLIDTIIFISIAFYSVVPNAILLNMIITQFVLKVIIAVLDTPFIYAALKIYDKYRG